MAAADGPRGGPGEAREDPAESRRALERWLAAKLPGAEGVSVSEPRRPEAGASSETRLFEAEWREAGEPRRLEAVLRSTPEGPGVFPEYDLATQFRLLETLHSASRVPVPEALWLEEDPAVLGAPFFLMRRVAGEAPVEGASSYHSTGFYRDATPRARREMWSDLVGALAELHALDWRALGLGFVPGAQAAGDPLRAQLDYWTGFLEDWIKDAPGESYPVFEAALAWLEENRYVPGTVALCWGDAKLGNALYRREKLSAVLDWELARIGDPELDLASLYVSDRRAWEGQGLAEPLPGTPSRDELVREYEERSGRPVRRFRYNEVFATLWRGLAVLRIMKRMRAQGAPIPADRVYGGFAVERLEKLLEPPGR